MPTTLHDLANFLQKQADRTRNNPELQAYYQQSADRYRAKARKVEGFAEKWLKPRSNGNNGAHTNSIVSQPSMPPIGLRMDEQLRQFIKQGLAVRDVLQIVEDALAEQGYNDFTLVTDRGAWQWITVERFRERAAEGARRQVREQSTIVQLEDSPPLTSSRS